MISRYNQRFSIINFFYHHFVMDYKILDTKQFWLRKKNFDQWQIPIFKFIFNNYDDLIQRVKDNLDEKWKFEEISNFEKSILLVASAEYFSKITPIEVVISEAVKMTQKYSGIKNYKYINNVLDNMFKKEL